ncbi:hypothetical protein [Paenibacillus donghaensis]|uniref:Uncharacterized protein n=1 Tax=Paenibacillus donghaensis TaxID=414771 RepID=A0A2Z2K5X8_9BACL|nr:hypothetical protein [Paenibacillus donghaensis]ASA20047.1 hypothetical protein B9T62_04100 [Paenibacillus donghaensis]
MRTFSRGMLYRIGVMVYFHTAAGYYFFGVSYMQSRGEEEERSGFISITINVAHMQKDEGIFPHGEEPSSTLKI